MSDNHFLKTKPFSVLLTLVLFLILGTTLLHSQIHQHQTSKKDLNLQKQLIKMSQQSNRRLIVSFYPEKASAASRVSLHAVTGTRVLKSFSYINADLVRLPEGTSMEKTLRSYRQMPEVKYAQPDYLLKLSPVKRGDTLQSTRASAPGSAVEPNDPLFKEQWALYQKNNGSDINAIDAWKKGTGSGSVIVAVIDSGVDYNHEDLKDRMWANQAELHGKAGKDDDGNGYVDDIYGYDFANKDSDPMDDNSHGTHCAGIIAASQNNGVGISGIAPGVKIMALKFLGETGSGYTSDAIKCFEYAIKMGATITSNSYGGSAYNPALSEAVNRYGKLTVFSAGNDYTDLDRYPVFPCCMLRPNMLVVLSTTSNKELANGSNFGASRVQLGAPGEKILSCVPGNRYEYKSGTSMAAPLVAGLAALVISREPEISAQELTNRLMATCSLENAISGKAASHGIINAGKAITPGNLPPVPKNVRFKAQPEAKVGAKFRVGFTPCDQDGDPVKSTRVKWYARDMITGRESLLLSGPKSFKADTGLGGQQIRCEVRLIPKKGNKNSYYFTSDYSEPLKSTYPEAHVTGVLSKSNNYFAVTGEIYRNNAPAIKECGIEYYPLKKPNKVKRIKSKGSRNSVNQLITGLKPNTSYGVRLYARNRQSTVRSAAEIVTTMPAKMRCHKLLPEWNSHQRYSASLVSLFENLAFVKSEIFSKDWLVYKYDVKKAAWQFEKYFQGDSFAVPVANSNYVFSDINGTADLQIYKRNKGDWDPVQTLKDCAFGLSLTVATEVELFKMTTDVEKYYEARINVYKLNSGSGQWLLSQTIEAPDGREDALFGTRFAVSGDSMIITEGFNPDRTTAVNVYIYQKNPISNKWVEAVRVTPLDVKKDHVDYAITINDKYAAISVFGNGSDPNRVVIFEKDAKNGKWKQLPNIVDTGEGARYFINLLALQGEVLWINTVKDITFCPRAYRKVNGKFVQDNSIVFPESRFSVTSGFEMYSSPDAVIFGDPNDDETDTRAGAAVIIHNKDMK